MKVSEKILRCLAENGIDSIYGVPSGTISHIIDSINDVKEIEYIVTKNEAAASYSACKYAKVSQKIGVCAISGSVGVANAMNGIAEAAKSKAPIIILSGHINQYQEGLGVIQELESYNVLGGIVKHSIKIRDEKNAIKELNKAMKIAMTHPRGPVNVTIPLDIQKSNFTGEEPKYENPNTLEMDYKKIKHAVEIINSVGRGIILVGGGCRGLGNKIESLAEKLNWRLVTSPSAKSVVEEEFRLHMGNFGFPGTDLANEYINKGDYECVLALGSGLGESSTLNFNKNLGHGKLIHIHVDKKVFNRAYEADISISSEMEDAINYIIENVNQKIFDNDVKENLNKSYIKNHTGISLRLLCENVSKYLPQNTFYMSDIGEIMVFMLKYLKVPKGGDYECDISYGCMGCSVGSLGVSRIDKKRQIAVFVGDGSFYMNIMSELLTAKKYNMKIVFFVINNSNLGFVDRGHKAIFGRGFNGFCDEYVDISNIVKAMGIPAIKIREFNEIDKLQVFLKDEDGPKVVEIITDSTEPIPSSRFKSLSK